MAHAHCFGAAFAKAQMAVGDSLPRPEDGAVVISVNDFDKSAALKIGRDLARLGFRLMATCGTATMLRRVGVEVQTVNKVSEGKPHLLDLMRAGEVSLIINTPLGSTSFSDGRLLRQESARLGIPLITTLTAAQAAINGIKVLATQAMQVRSLQALHNGMEEDNARPQAALPRFIPSSGQDASRAKNGTGLSTPDVEPKGAEENEATIFDPLIPSFPHSLIVSS
jgi:carbamoyl-phosphate synthase large subunit